MTEDNAPFSGDAVARYDGWYHTPWGGYADVRQRDLLLAMARPATGERMLDVGCGTGRYLSWLVGMGLDAFGAEPSSHMLVASATRLAVEGIEEGRLIGAEAEALPFADGAFDLVMAVTVIEFVDDERGVIAEMARVGRGRLFIGALNAASRYGRQLAAGETGETLSHARLHTVEELVELVRDAARPASLTWRTCLLGPKVHSAAELEPQKRLDALPGSTRLPWGAYIGVLADLRR